MSGRDDSKKRGRGKGGRGRSGRGRSGRGGSRGRGGRGHCRGGRGKGKEKAKDDKISDITTTSSSKLSAKAPKFDPTGNFVAKTISKKSDDHEQEGRKVQLDTANTKEKQSGRDKARKGCQKPGIHSKVGKASTRSRSDSCNDSFEKGGTYKNKEMLETTDRNNKRRPKGSKLSHGDQNNISNGKKKGKSKQKQEEKVESLEAQVPHKPSLPPSEPQTTNNLNYKRGEKITVLHIAEKPSIAQAIAKGLARGETQQSGKGLPMHLFDNPPFPKAPHASKCEHKVTSVAGHVFTLDFPAAYSSWDSVDPAELFQAPVVKKPCKGSVVKHLQDSARGANFIVLWLDCDREGENIAFEVLDCAMHLMEGGGGSSHYDRVYRAYFSAINPSDIQKAYNALGKPDKNQSLSVDARQELDLKVGVAFSRFQTRYFQGRYGDLDSSVLSYGPCQTPT